MALVQRDTGWEKTADGKLDMSVGGKASALATDATHGFLFIPTCAGTPTGVPTTRAGHVAFVFDTSNNKLYVYDGGWIGTAALS